MLHTFYSRFRAAALLTALFITFSMLGISPSSANNFGLDAHQNIGVEYGAAGLGSPIDPSVSPGGAEASHGELASGFHGVEPGTYSLTLITGARLQVDVYDDGTAAVAAHADDWDKSSFWSVDTDDAFYLFPDDVHHLVPHTLDSELFNVSYLIANGYHDDALDSIPVIVTSNNDARPDDSVSLASVLPGFRQTMAFTSIAGAAGSFAKSADLTALQPVFAAAGETIAGGSIEKVWLDRMVSVSLEDSGPIMGAPAAWDLGYDGEGITVAVLDTGIDAQHPDLADRVVMAENFTDDPDATDGHGHGTHVAGIVAGSGAASDGLRKGMAPGAKLISGKVLSDSGRGPLSGVIAGMEWAAANADIVNMSLGGALTDGTDPVSEAVNSLTEQHGVLFVVSAGNDGPGKYTVSSPGAADLALTVGNTDKNDNLAGTSSRGPRLGDHAIKPEITATGSSIGAARAAGTSGGTIIDEHYTRLSGTSMAAPQVAGAAAILLQKRPNAHHSELKAALSSTAVPNPNLTVYEQGGGRLDISRALQTEVVPSAAAMNFGYFPYPHEEAEPITRTLAYTNIGDDDVTLTLSAAAADEDGNPAAEGAVELSTSEITVPAGGEASVDVTVDIPALDYGQYGGYLTASADGDIVLRTPLGFFKEAEMYDLTITGIARDGRPATGNSSVDVMSLDDRDSLNESVRFTDGEVVFRVAPGTYAINSFIYTYTEPDDRTHELTFVAEPAVEVASDMTITMDARPATKLQVQTPEVTKVEFLSVAYYQVDAKGGGMRKSLTTNIVDDRLYTVPTGPEPDHMYEFYTRHILSAPEIGMQIISPVYEKLESDYMSGSPKLDGLFEYDAVAAGLGTPEDFEGVDAEGKAVFMERGVISFSDKARNAFEAGAAVAIIYNNEPGSFNGTVGTDPTIPAFGLTRDEGLFVVGLLEDGEVTLVLQGAPVSPFKYDLIIPEPGGFQDELIYVPGENVPVVALETSYYSDVSSKEQSGTRNFWRPYMSTGIGLTQRFIAPLQRVEYVAANDTRYRHSVNYTAPYTGRQEGPMMIYEPGDVMEMSWWKQAVRPGFIEGNALHPAKPNARVGNSLHLAIIETADGSNVHWGDRHASADTTEFRYYRDGALIATEDRGYEKLFPMVPGSAEYRLELDWSRDTDGWLTSVETATAWTFTSEGTPSHELLPLLIVEYDLPVNLMNHLTEAGIGLNVRHQKGAQTSPIAGAELEISFDDGATWEAVQTEDTGSGYFTATLPAPEGDADYVSFRVEAWDEAGSRIEQTIMRAAAWAVEEALELTVTEPEDGTHTNDDTITVAGSAVDPSGRGVTVTVNGEEADVEADGTFEIRILLPEDDGDFTIDVVAAGENGGTATESRTVTVDRTPPVIYEGTIDPGVDVELEWGDEIAVSFFGEPGLKASYQLLVPGADAGDDGLPGVAIEEVDEGVYKGVYKAPEGAAFTGAEVEIYAMDLAGNITTVTAPGKVTVIPDEVEDPIGPPTVTIDEPADGFLTNRDAVRVSGTATDEQEDQEIEEVTVNGRAVEVAADGSFTTRIILWEGDNVITVTATNTAGETATEAVTVEADWTAPSLTNIQPSGDVNLEWGDSLTIRFKSEDRLTAAYQIVVDGSHGTWITRDIPVKGTPMRAVGSDLTGTTYEATFTAPEGMTLENAIIQINAADEAGNVIMTTAPGELTVVEGD